MRQLVGETHAGVSGERAKGEGEGAARLAPGAGFRHASRTKTCSIAPLLRAIRVRWLTDDRYFIVGNPAAFQALKPPAMERTFL